MYSTRPSREALGLSSFVSAVKRAVAPVVLICWDSENRRALRSTSSGNIMFRRDTESTTTRSAPKAFMNFGSSDRTFITVVLASAGSSFTFASRFSFSGVARSHPKPAALATIESGSSSREMKIPFSRLMSPWTRNWIPNVVFPVPKEPRTVTVWPRGTPPPRSSSSPSIPVSTIPFPAVSGAARSSAAASVILRDPLHVHDDEALLARDHRREPRDLVPPEVGQDARELFHVHVPLPVRAVRVRPPLEREAAVDAVDHHLLEPLLQDPPGEEEVRDPAPVLRRPLESLDRRHEVPHLDRLRLHEVREAVDYDEGAGGVLVEERHEAF